MVVLASMRGLAIAASFFAAGGLASSSFVAIPSILSTSEQEATTAQTLARQFDVGYHFGKIIQVPAELFAVLAFGYLAFQTRTMDGSSWKLYSGAAAAMFTVFPWTILMMERDSQKIISLAEPETSHAADKEPKLEHGKRLARPNASRGSITPVEEFEPFEDSPFSGAEYEKLKIRKLLQSWSTRNIVRIISTALAGALALSAVTTRVTIVTIVQGR